jgi:uncharacterized protein with PIN domain
MKKIFTLSVLRPWAEQLVQGTKLWEFRANPQFGVREKLSVGDVLLIVAMDDAPAIIAWSELLEVYRGDDLEQRFGRPELVEYHVALRLETHALPRPIACAEVKRQNTARSWGGQGFMLLSNLHRYRLDGAPLGQALRRRVPALPAAAPRTKREPAHITFHGSLLELPGVRPQVKAAPGCAKDVLESQGAIHCEVDALTLNGQGATLADEIPPGAQVEVWPVGEGPKHAPRLIPPPPAPPRFVIDVHLTAMARHLRLLGLDVADPIHVDDAIIAQQSADQGRVMLTRDVGLLKRSVVEHGLWVRDKDPEEQARQILTRYVKAEHIAPLTRCLLCNGVLQGVERDSVLEQLPEAVRALQTPFYRCQGCQRVYWRGTHLDGLLERLRRLVPGLV